MKINKKYILFKIILVVIIIYLLSSCACGGNKEERKQIPIKQTSIILKTASGTKYLYIYEIDGCEYIGRIDGAYADVLIHKGNCKFCAERLKKH